MRKTTNTWYFEETKEKILLQFYNCTPFKNIYSYITGMMHSNNSFAGRKCSLNGKNKQIMASLQTTILLLNL